MRLVSNINIMGCVTVSSNGKVPRSTAIEIIDESEYNKNPKYAHTVNLVSKGNKIRIHYRELGGSDETCCQRKD